MSFRPLRHHLDEELVHPPVHRHGIVDPKVVGGGVQLLDHGLVGSTGQAAGVQRGSAERLVGAEGPDRGRRLSGAPRHVLK